MDHRLNGYGQPIGLPVALDLPRPLPPHTALRGEVATLVPLSADHADGFFEVFTDPAGWTYLGDETPFADRDAARAWTATKANSRDPLFYTVLVDDRPVGFLSLLRINPQAASIEVGFIHFSPALQGTRAATEVQYLLMRHVFEDLGYRRYEWKCDALNAPSRRAALRLGFTFEGIFRQALVYKGRNRDTAWYSVIDCEWPARRTAFETWLAPANFDADGRQRQSLSACATG
ncbi:MULTISPECIES: GNAT family N-acetyltransferase [Mameliella]|uniref:GNAT family N-acetyltransferase n=1 Tax=Mameliella TaxID=1434019 RepID=UPI000B52D729|nr:MULTISPECIES: GNAT family protein [Mameliella]MCR9275240.1 GNAT family N-acetyltransferase [Paracoccaceae bacterium]OWV59116.1 GNAT family N-acetyltransferase [Mameliella alba]